MIQLPKRAKDITNKRYGRLVALEPTDKKDKKGCVIWKCKCDCGNECEKSTKLLLGETRSCGCLQRESLKTNHLRLEIRNTKPKGWSSFNALLVSYKNNAKRRGLDFGLTEDEFRTITSSNCSYCGREPKTIEYDSQRNGTYLRNGIDRLNSDKGYTSGNCVPCCSICNYAKREMSEKEFLDWIKQVYEYRNLS